MTPEHDWRALMLSALVRTIESNVVAFWVPKRIAVGDSGTFEWGGGIFHATVIAITGARLTLRIERGPFDGETVFLDWPWLPPS